MRRYVPLAALALLAVGLAAFPRHVPSNMTMGDDFVHFESGHVHPLEMTPSGERLLVVNTFDNRLSVFDITGPAPVRISEIPVGMEPVSVRCLNDSIAYVVNKLSDSFSVVDLTAMHVRRTLRVGDEPEDVVFAGAAKNAFVSIGGEDVIKVFETVNVTQINTIPVNGHHPRALAVSPDGSKVYAAILDAGNRTTSIKPRDIASDSLPQITGLFGTGGDIEYPRNGSLPTPPNVGLIVQHNSFDGNWYDMWGNVWTHRVPYTPREVDIVRIDAATQTVSAEYGDFGSHQFGIAVEPVTGTLGITHTLARNEQRFEPRLKGYLVEQHIDFLETGGTRKSRVTNPQTNFFNPGLPTQAELDSAMGIPTGVAAAPGVFYITSLANNRVGVINPLAGGLSHVRARINVVEGPTGISVDNPRNRLYVLGRFRNQLQTLSSTNFTQVDVQSIGFDPRSDEIVHGQRFMYGGFTSKFGEEACASCHIFGDTDNLGWNLGDPTASFTSGTAPLEGYDPEKGVMVTQSLRGHNNTGLLHWRGDRADFAAFNPAFVGLMGDTTVLADSQMTAFTNFAAPLVHPPNPNQNLDRSYPTAPLGQGSAERGRQFFFNTVVGPGGETCESCHTAANFGPGTNMAVLPDDSLATVHRSLDMDQDLKVPQLRNLYTKVGFDNTPAAVTKLGFGFGHDGSAAKLQDFIKDTGLTLGASQPEIDQNAMDLAAYLVAFDAGMAPAVGQQVTFDGTNNNHPADAARLDTLLAQADLGYCEVIARGVVAGQPRSWLYRGSGLWQSDKGAELKIATATLRNMGEWGTEVTAMAVPPGTGRRIGVDRDRDGIMDGDELDAGTDPGDPNDTPILASVDPTTRGAFTMLGVRPNPFRTGTEIHFRLGARGPVTATVFDVMGREVRSLARNQVFEAGEQSLRWDGAAGTGRIAGPGVYFVRVQTQGATWNRPLVRIR